MCEPGELDPVGVHLGDVDGLLGVVGRHVVDAESGRQP